MPINAHGRRYLWVWDVYVYDMEGTQTIVLKHGPFFFLSWAEVDRWFLEKTYKYPRYRIFCSGYELYY